MLLVVVVELWHCKDVHINTLSFILPIQEMPELYNWPEDSPGPLF